MVKSTKHRFLPLANHGSCPDSAQRQYCKIYTMPTRAAFTGKHFPNLV